MHAQEVTGDLRFSVRDSLGDPIPGVNAAVTGADLQGVRGTVSDGAGRCVILALPPGLISVRLSHPAYHSVVFENVRIQLGKTTSLGDIALRQSVHDMPEIVVTIDRAEIDASSTTYGSNLRPAEVDFLPLERNYKEMIAMLPLSNFSYYGDGMNIGGSTGYENKYVVDGVEVTDPLIQTSGTNLPYNFIREVEVKAGGYEADGRSALGGVLNVVTYSGTNELRGSVFGFYTSNRFGGDRRVVSFRSDTGWILELRLRIRPWWAHRSRSALVLCRIQSYIHAKRRRRPRLRHFGGSNNCAFACCEAHVERYRSIESCHD